MLRRHFINVSYSGDIQPNHIWYKTSNGEKFEYNIIMSAIFLEMGVLPSTLLKKNYLIHDDWWCLTFSNDITYTGITESGIGPILSGMYDVLGLMETNGLNIIEIKLPSISFIGKSTFHCCAGLQSITIPNSVTSIEYGAFSGCSSLTSIIIPNSVTSIGELAFAVCSSLTSVTIGNSVTSIGDYAFLNCSSFTSVTIPESVTSIGEGAFRDCSSLTGITFNGTKAQWNMINLGSNWNTLVPATVVHCTDGDVEI